MLTNSTQEHHCSVMKQLILRLWLVIMYMGKGMMSHQGQTWQVRLKFKLQVSFSLFL